MKFCFLCVAALLLFGCAIDEMNRAAEDLKRAGAAIGDAAGPVGAVYPPGGVILAGVGAIVTAVGGGLASWTATRAKAKAEQRSYNKGMERVAEVLRGNGSMMPPQAVHSTAPPMPSAAPPPSAQPTAPSLTGPAPAGTV